MVKTMVVSGVTRLTICLGTICLGAICLGNGGVAEAAGWHDVECEGHYPKHLQGVCTDGEANIYWSFTDWLVKTDASGSVLEKVRVADHHGDLCFAGGKLYVAVNLGQFNQPAGKADSWVYVYDASDLKELARHEVQQVVHGAGGMEHHEGRFYVVGGLPENVDENYVYEYDAQFQFVRRHVIASGHTHLGIQTAAFAEGKWWFGCYGSPAVTLVTDEQFRVLSNHAFNCSLGVVGLGGGKVFVASGACQAATGCSGSLRVLKVAGAKLE